eukprot:1191555-Prorocentrum_minimum.AAC.8
MSFSAICANRISPLSVSGSVEPYVARKNVTCELAPKKPLTAFSARFAGRGKSTLVHQTQRIHNFSRSRCVRTCALFGKKKAVAADGPKQLASAKLGPEVDTDELLNMLRTWAFSFSSSGLQSLTLALQVDSIEDGVRMSLIEVKDGQINPLVWYDMTVRTCLRHNPFKYPVPSTVLCC